MKFDNLLSDIYSESKEYILPFAAAFPLVYFSLTFGTDLAEYSYFDKIVFSLALEIAVFLIVTYSFLLIDIPKTSPKQGAIVALHVVVVAFVTYLITILFRPTSIPGFLCGIVSCIIGAIIGLVIIKRVIAKRERNREAHDSDNDVG
jgi:hypothetical protein